MVEWTDTLDDTLRQLGSVSMSIVARLGTGGPFDIVSVGSNPVWSGCLSWSTHLLHRPETMPFSISVLLLVAPGRFDENLGQLLVDY